MRGIPLPSYTTPSMVEKRPSTITMYLALPVEERRETPSKKPPKKQKFFQSMSFRPRRQRPDTTNVRGRPLRLQCRGRRGRPHPPHRPPRPRLSTLSMPHRSSDVEFSFLLKKIFPLLFYLNKNASLAIWKILTLSHFYLALASFVPKWSKTLWIQYLENLPWDFGYAGSAPRTVFGPNRTA